MFNTRGGFPGQRPMGPPRMNQPGLNHLGMNMSGMNMSGMNMSGMGMSSMNQPNMNLSGMNQPNMNLSGMNQPNMNLSSMNQPNMNTGMPRMGHPGMNTNVGLANVNPPGVNPYRMGPTGMNQGGMGFQSEIKGQGFGMRPMDSPGTFLGGSSEPMGMKGMPMRTPERHMGPQAVPQRFSSSSSPMTPAQPRMIMQNQEIPSIVNRVLQHSSDHMRANPKTPLQEPSHLMEKKAINPLTMFGNLSQDMGMKPGPSSSLEQMSNPQNRYTNESASSILESFGLSNEDLEELSRYPDEQLTPANLPNILRDIRLRKINRSGGSHDQGGGGRRQGGEVLPSKVIDYGHSSKYQYKDNSAPFDSSRTGQKQSPASKEPAPSSSNKNGKGKIAMDNKIPTISSSRKATWQGSKSDRSNNKTLVGEQTAAKTSDGSITALKKESPVITIKPDSSTLCDIPVISDTVTTSPSNMAAESPIETVVSQVNYPPPAEATTPTAKGSWVPAMSQDEAQKMKRMPTPSMMNDYFAASPRIFPHICSLCNVECRHLKDWIKHQNNTSHIESCRKLRQQYPDWNPQVHTLRNDTKKDETTPKRSRSKSGSPRRSRRSGSRSRARRTRSRSPRSGRRSRSRSPRRSRHSPRHSRSPRKGARSPRRSPSPRRIRRGRSSTPPDKRAVDAAVQSFIEASKLKSGEKPKSTSDVKKLPTISANSNVKGKKPASGSTPTKSSSNPAKKTSGSTSSSSSKKPERSSSVKSGSSSNGNASRSAPKKPLPSTKKPVVSTGVKKTTSSTASTKKPPNKTSSAQKGPKQTASESYNPLNKFTSKSGSDKIIHVTNLPDSGYTDQDILKMVQPFGKVCDILIVRSKNEAFLETNFKEAAAAAVKFSETVPVMINGKRAVLALAGRHKEQAKRETKGTSGAESEKSSLQKAAPAKEQKVEKPLKEEKAVKDEKAHKVEKGKKKAEVPKHDIEVPPGFVKCHRLSDPPLKEAEKCVVVISNLPEKQYTVEEVSNLAKPFGGVNDILIITNYRKAYLELPSRNSVDSMLKFYSVFPTCLSGSTLNIAMAAAYKDLKDENRIFAELIEQASFKIIPTIYEKFVHLSNLPEKEIQEFELTRIGLRFGKVEHYVLLSNKRKAILHMNSPGAANGMHTFLSRFPVRIGESVLKCTLVSKPKLSENEYITYLEEKKSSAPDHNMYEEVSSTPDVSQLEEQPSSGTHIAETDVKVSGTYSNVEVEDDDDDEEAAEAPEAPDTPSCFIEPEPVEEKPAYNEVPQSYVTEESDVLVSVESDEECDSPCTDEPNAIPVMDCASMERLLTAEDSESENNDMETSAKETAIDCPKPVDKAVDDQNYLALEQKPEDEGNEELHVEASQAPDTTAEPLVGKGSENTSVVLNPPAKEETSPPRAEESSDKDTKSESGRSPRDGKNRRSEESANSHDEKSRQRSGRSRQSSHGKPTDELIAATEESKDAEQAAPPGKSPVTRTTKYNPQRGELSITLTVDSQKSSSRVPDSKKRVSGDKGPSGKESTIPKSSSNRSSPLESASSNPKMSAGSYQTKSSHRGTSSQDRDSKVSIRSRDNDSRSNRKDDRSKDSNSSSSRHMRSSTRSTRGQRSKEEGADTFPFNLDEFVTVDEIVEEHTDSTKEEKDEERKSQVISKEQTPKRGGKRKDTHPPASDAKKPKEASGDPQELSFVTLDEVGDEEDNTPTPESIKDEAAPSQVKEDEVHAEDKVDAVEDSTPSTQEPCVLMTLDEVSDDDEPNASAMPSGSSTIPDKDQLLTLDEISGEDEEQTSHSEPSNPEKWLPQEMEEKEGNSSADPETKEKPEVPDVPPQEPDEESHTEQPLLTLDEVKADDDEEEDSLADIEHHFLTVDEIGEEEDDSVVKEEDVEEPQPISASKPRQTKRKTSPKLSQPEPKTPAGRRGRPRKRPLSETTADNKDTSKQTSADSGTVNETDKTPTKPKSKATKGAEQPAKGTEQAEANSSTMTTPDKPGSGTSETPAKKTKLETPSSEKTKLAAFNSSVPVGLEFLVPKTGYFCELCSLFYMDDASKIKHCKSLRHFQAVQKHFAKEEKMEEEKSPST